MTNFKRNVYKQQQMLTKMCGGKEPSYTVGGNVNWYNHYGKQYGGRLFKTPKIELPYDPAIPLLGILPKECKSGYKKDTCIHMFITGLFTVVKIWKQPRCPTTDEWIKKILYI
jgi:hypothetical protein